MASYPAELYGLPITNTTPKAQTIRQDQWCPFINAKCHKKSGVCSVQHQTNTIAICPSRLRQNDLVFQNIANDYFKTQDNILIFSEVNSGDTRVGSFDYVMVKHKPLSSQIEDFVVVEFQTADTVSTGKLNLALKEFHAGNEVANKNYGFGINWANVWKRCFIQILNKGRILDHWGQKVYWVAQVPTYQYLIKAYGLEKAMKHGSEGSTVFMVYDLEPEASGYHLFHAQTESSNMVDLLMAFGSNPEIPSKDKFLTHLETTTKKQVHLNLALK